MSGIYQRAPDQGDEELEDRFWSAVDAGRLEFQTCLECGYARWPPGATCPECLSARFSWRQDNGQGEVWSYCRYIHPGYSNAIAEVPYTLVAVQLDSGPFLHGVLAGDAEVGIGSRVQFRSGTGASGCQRRAFYVINPAEGRDA